MHPTQQRKPAASMDFALANLDLLRASDRLLLAADDVRAARDKVISIINGTPVDHLMPDGEPQPERKAVDHG